MPNWATNRIVPASLQDWEVIRQALASPDPEEGADFSFQGLRPMPACLDGTVAPAPQTIEQALSMLRTHGPQDASLAEAVNLESASQDSEAFDRLGYAEETYAATPTPTKKADKDSEVVRAWIRAWVTTGYMTWYDWALANWGTKWDMVYPIQATTALPCGVRVPTLKFDTAWNAPDPILQALAEACPGVAFLHEVYEEGSEFAEETLYMSDEYGNVSRASSAWEDLEVFRWVLRERMQPGLIEDELAYLDAPEDDGMSEPPEDAEGLCATLQGLLEANPHMESEMLLALDEIARQRVQA